MAERCDRPCASTGDVEMPVLETLGALGIPDGATRVTFISADGYRRVVFPRRKPRF